LQSIKTKMDDNHIDDLDHSRISNPEEIKLRPDAASGSNRSSNNGEIMRYVKESEAGNRRFRRKKAG